MGGAAMCRPIFAKGNLNEKKGTYRTGFASESFGETGPTGTKTDRSPGAKRRKTGENTTLQRAWGIISNTDITV